MTNREKAWIVAFVIVVLVIIAASIDSNDSKPGSASERCVHEMIAARSAYCKENSLDLYDYRKCMDATTDRIAADCAAAVDK